MKFSNLLPIPDGLSETFFLTDSITANADLEPIHYPMARDVILRNLYVTSRRNVPADASLVFQVVVDSALVPGFLVTFTNTPADTTLGVVLDFPVAIGSVIDLQVVVTKGGTPKVYIVSAAIGFA